MSSSVPQQLASKPLLQGYLQALNPVSIEELVGKDVLQSLMQSFHYRLHAGMTLFYDTGRNEKGELQIKKLGPEEGPNLNKPDNFNAFCHAFRQDPDSDSACNACDLNRARRILDNAGEELPVRYECHVHLIDMTLPVFIAGKCRAVFFAGQKIVREDEKQILKIKASIAQKAASRTDLLEPLIEKCAENAAQIEQFESAFRSFASVVQKVVTATYNARCAEAMQETLLQVSQHLSGTITASSNQWLTPVQKLVDELSGFVGGLPVWFLVRKNSRYQVMASSQNGLGRESMNIRVVSLISMPVGKWQVYFSNDKMHAQLRERLPLWEGAVSAIRIDSPAPNGSPLSTVMVIGGMLNTGQSKLVDACFKLISYPAHASVLFGRLQAQQDAFARTTSFTGHHLKTPIQSALFSLKELSRVSGDSPEDAAQRQMLYREAEYNILMGFFDAMQMQTTAMDAKEEVDVYELLSTLAREFKLIGSARLVEIKLQDRAELNYKIWAVKVHIRIALSNLLDNAVKHSVDMKEVRISCKQDTFPDVGGPVQYLTVSIENLGGHIDEAKRHQMLESEAILDNTPASEEVQHRRGYGYGWQQSRELIEMEGGILDIESCPVQPLPASPQARFNARAQIRVTAAFKTV